MSPRMKILAVAAFIFTSIITSSNSYAFDLFSKSRFSPEEQSSYQYLCQMKVGQWDRSCVQKIWNKHLVKKRFLAQQGYRYVLKNINLHFFTLVLFEAEKRYQLDAKLLLALALTESSLNPQAVSPVGAKGVFQVMPDTAAWVWERFLSSLSAKDVLRKKDPRKNLHDVRLSVLLGSYYLKYLHNMFNDNEIYALASYNVGPGRVGKSIKNNIYRKPEDFLLGRDYFTKIISIREKMENIL